MATWTEQDGLQTLVAGELSGVVMTTKPEGGRYKWEVIKNEVVVVRGEARRLASARERALLSMVDLLLPA